MIPSALYWLAISVLAMSFSAFAETPAEPRFCTTYEECRAEFVKLARAATAGTNGTLFSLPIPSRFDADLTMDGMHLPPTGKAENLLVITTGVHGVEGYAGNVVLQMFLREVLPTLDRTHTGVLLVHGINAYGMKYFRRVSENGVDLNRNFDTSPSLFTTQNPGYLKMSEILNPTTPAKLGERAKIRYYASVAQMLASNSIATLRQAVLQGQYEHERGIYFGGKQFEPQKEMLDTLLTATARPYQNVLALDIHTGYGPRGKLFFFTDPPKEGGSRALYDRVFVGLSGRHVPANQEYKSAGDFPVYVGNLLRSQGKNVVPMMFEYGTVDNHTTTGGLQSIRNFVLENQMFWYGADLRSSERFIRKQFFETFLPSAPSWRAALVERTRELLPLLIKRFSAERAAPADCGEALKAQGAPAH